jgi:hypothetical protein
MIGLAWLSLGLIAGWYLNSAIEARRRDRVVLDRVWLDYLNAKGVALYVRAIIGQGPEAPVTHQIRATLGEDERLQIYFDVIDRILAGPEED